MSSSIRRIREGCAAARTLLRGGTERISIMASSTTLTTRAQKLTTTCSSHVRMKWPWALCSSLARAIGRSGGGGTEGGRNLHFARRSDSRRHCRCGDLFSSACLPHAGNAVSGGFCSTWPRKTLASTSASARGGYHSGQTVKRSLGDSVRVASGPDELRLTRPPEERGGARGL